MEQETFKRLQSLIHGECGIFIGHEKCQLLVNRLRKRLISLKLRDEREYVEYLEHDRDRVELGQLLNAVSTNVTYFGREFEHFVEFSRILREWQRKRTMRVWCAASSTGEEPYTLAMVAAESVNLSMIDFKVLATDINSEVLAAAQQGVYTAANAQKLSPALRTKYFDPLPGGTDVRVSPAIRKLVIFKRLNLAQLPTPLHGPIDVIFCRNVMIYFDLELRARLIAEFERLLIPGGYLFLSHSENLLGIEHNLRSAGLSCYRKQG